MTSSNTLVDQKEANTETNPVPECTEREKRNVWWCESCNVPLLSSYCENCGNKGHRVAADIKPIFEEERKYIYTCTKDKGLLNLPIQLLWMRNRTVYFNGKPYIVLPNNGRSVIIKKFERSGIARHPPNVDTLRKANESALKKLEDEAISFIRQVVSDYPNRRPIVSFSGGKDSTTVSFLVRKALNTNKILHVFGDTSIEYPDTYDYIDAFCSDNVDIPFIKTRCEQEWFNMCDILEPPSRILRWCCTVFKASPLGKALNQINDEHGVISFEGLKRCESNLRRKAKRIYHSKKIAKQVSAEPILDWSDLSVWLYILTNHIPFNTAYEKGFSRVGCLYCPYTTVANERLMQKTYPKEIRKWKRYLINRASFQGKDDPTDYVLSGAWKSRAGTNGNSSGNGIKRYPGSCGGEIENNYVLSKPVSPTFLDFFRPLGILNSVSHPELGVFIVKDFVIKEPIFQFQAIEGWTRLSITILVPKGRHLLRQRIERQIKKFTNCIQCGGCVGVCPTGALQINTNLTIDHKKCISCLKCSTYTDRGCIALGSLKRKNSIEDLVL